jgi:hypothetical protein
VATFQRLKYCNYPDAPSDYFEVDPVHLLLVLVCLPFMKLHPLCWRLHSIAATAESLAINKLVKGDSKLSYEG